MAAAYQKLPNYATAWLTIVERCLTLRWAVPGVRLEEGELRRAQQPTSLSGEKGSLRWSGDRRTVVAIPDAEIEAASGGHLPWLDQPASCAETVLRFLRSRVLVG